MELKSIGGGFGRIEKSPGRVVNPGYIGFHVVGYRVVRFFSWEL